MVSPQLDVAAFLVSRGRTQSLIRRRQISVDQLPFEVDEVVATDRLDPGTYGISITANDVLTGARVLDLFFPDVFEVNLPGSLPPPPDAAPAPPSLFRINEVVEIDGTRFQVTAARFDFDESVLAWNYDLLAANGFTLRTVPEHLITKLPVGSPLEPPPPPPPAVQKFPIGANVNWVLATGERVPGVVISFTPNLLNPDENRYGLRLDISNATISVFERDLESGSGVSTIEVSGVTFVQPITWNLSTWSASGRGTWNVTPRLTVSGSSGTSNFTFPDPQGYIDALSDIEVVANGTASGFIREFEAVQGQFSAPAPQFGVNDEVHVGGTEPVWLINSTRFTTRWEYFVVPLRDNIPGSASGWVRESLITLATEPTPLLSVGQQVVLGSSFVPVYVIEQRRFRSPTWQYFIVPTGTNPNNAPSVWADEADLTGF